MKVARRHDANIALFFHASCGKFLILALHIVTLSVWAAAMDLTTFLALDISAISYT